MLVNEIPRTLGSQARKLHLESIARTCEAIDRVRLSRAATRHAIERSRESLHETQALLVALRHIYSGDCRRLAPTAAGHSRVKGN
jgi:hypothetical protein